MLTLKDRAGQMDAAKERQREREREMDVSIKTPEHTGECERKAKHWHPKQCRNL